MLLLYQVGTVKIGEVVRYTVTYTPSRDRILPSPPVLHLRVRNSSAVALRAAFVHGPYTLSIAAYPACFQPDERFGADRARRLGVPEFEPMLKAGGTWGCRLVVPEALRQGAGVAALDSACGEQGNDADDEQQQQHSVTWIIEVQSQVIFSASAAVGYEILLARDEKSLSLGGPVPVLLGGQAQVPQPGRVSDYQRGLRAARWASGSGARTSERPQPLPPLPQPKGVFSRAIRLKVEDTASLWNTPLLPGWDEDRRLREKAHGIEVPFDPVGTGEHVDDLVAPKRPRRVHLVVLTHGLHSNLGGDMLYLKESIDAGVRQAKIDAKARRARERAEKREQAAGTARGDGEKEGEHKEEKLDEKVENADDNDEDEDEEVIVRGFSGNATRTERGIKYLGKRLARYVLSMTYPDQPFLPSAKTAVEMAHALKGAAAQFDAEGKPVHKHSTIHSPPVAGDGLQRLYRISKISFVAHSLGGLVQTYAIAYIQKHSPQFFDLIEPINFIAMATPFLGLNHENPLYVKFGLDFGLAGRTGQDLGLTWRAPTLARSGWGALVGSLGEGAHKRVLGEAQPESKPLLRILPTGPAHTALKKFRNRTVYSNVVNDGIVPLRTSCLLFLDWQGLGRVEKARREAGLVETVVGFGWAELTGANVSSPRDKPWAPAGGQVDDEDDAALGKKTEGPRQTPPSPPSPYATRQQEDDSHQVPQPSTNATLDDDRQSLRSVATTPYAEDLPSPSNILTGNPFSGFFNFFKSSGDPPKSPTAAVSPSHKQTKIYQRSQTLRMDAAAPGTPTSASSSQSRVTTGHELAETDSDGPSGMSAPPRTSFFESAVDLLNPTLPTVEFLIDPTKRPRTIFHDRIYHPTDIPPLPLKRGTTGSIRRRASYTRTSSSGSIHQQPQRGAGSTSSSPFPSPRLLHEDSALSQRDYVDHKTYGGPIGSTDHQQQQSPRTPDEQPPLPAVDSSSLRVEEKIARAYHRDMSWRKVLVKLPPDAHNNMIVRRTFANAFGWPVVKHLVDAHFSDSAAARTRDDEEDPIGVERARNPAEPPDEHGGETTREEEKGGGEGGQEDEGTATNRERQKMTPADGPADPDLRPLQRTESEIREASDAVPDLPEVVTSASTASMPQLLVPIQQRPRPGDRRDSEATTWSDHHFEDSADDTDEDEQEADESAHEAVIAAETNV